jgi:Uma2 family endonuclease
MPTRVGLTYSDYAALPDDGRRYELHRGELSMTPSPGTRHQGAVLALGARLYDHVKSRGLGKVFVAPTDCILSDMTVVQPDVLYVATDRLSIISERGIEGAPTLVVEVLSPSTAKLDRERKLMLYAEHGVPCFWIVDPASGTVEAYQLVGAAYVPAGRVTNAPVALPPLPDLEIDPAALRSCRNSVALRPSSNPPAALRHPRATMRISDVWALCPRW